MTCLTDAERAAQANAILELVRSARLVAVTSLLAERDTLAAENAQLRQECTGLYEICAARRGEVVRLEEEAEQLRQEVERLRVGIETALADFPDDDGTLTESQLNDEIDDIADGLRILLDDARAALAQGRGSEVQRG